MNFFFVFTDDNNDRKSQRVLNELENIDDECDALGIAFVKLDNSDEAKSYGVEKLPALMYFEKGIPTLYEGGFIFFRYHCEDCCINCFIFKFYVFL